MIGTPSYIHRESRSARAKRTSTWRRLNAGLMVKHIPLFGPGLPPAREAEHIRPDLTEWAGTTLIQSDERSYA